VEIKMCIPTPASKRVQHFNATKDAIDMDLIKTVIVSIKDIQYIFYQCPNAFIIQELTGMLNYHDFSCYFVSNWGLV